MAKSRAKSEILNVPLEVPDMDSVKEAAIDALLKQHSELKKLLGQIEGDLISLGHTFDAET